MYQPYPGSDTQLPETQRPPAPAFVRTAVKAMYVGAATSLLGIVIDLLTISDSPYPYEALQDADDGIVVVFGEEVDGLDANVRVIVFPEDIGEDYANGSVSGELLEALEGFEANGGAGIMIKRVYQRVPNLFGIGVIRWRLMEDLNGPEAHGGIRAIGHAADEQFLNGGVL